MFAIRYHQTGHHATQQASKCTLAQSSSLKTNVESTVSFICNLIFSFMNRKYAHNTYYEFHEELKDTVLFFILHPVSNFLRV